MSILERLLLYEINAIINTIYLAIKLSINKGVSIERKTS
jgi:hypothetical protein